MRLQRVSLHAPEHPRACVPVHARPPAVHRTGRGPAGQGPAAARTDAGDERMTADPLGDRPRLALDPALVRVQIARFLAEDVGGGDVTTSTMVPAGASARAR